MIFAELSVDSLSVIKTSYLIVVCCEKTASRVAFRWSCSPFLTGMKIVAVVLLLAIAVSLFEVIVDIFDDFILLIVILPCDF